MYPKLKNSALKKLETEVLYNFVTDELYELDGESFDFLSYCTGKNSFQEIIEKEGSDGKEAEDLMSYLLEEGCIEDGRDPSAVERFSPPRSTLPSLRYLQLHITEKCNLNCKHCYLGEKGHRYLDLKTIEKAMEGFSGAGLKLIITGGEPLLHDDFWDVLDRARGLPIRVELLSNGTLITDEIAARLSRYIDGIQISLDGLKDGHEVLRGNGSFDKALEGLKNAKKYLRVTCATMVHRGNISEFAKLERLLRRLGIDEWTIDIPSESGNMAQNTDLSVDFEIASEIFRKYGYSVGMHVGDRGYSCGSHICSVNVMGEVSKCGFFSDGVGNIRDESLGDCWRKVIEKYIPKLEELECGDCKALEECRGGCRYRALRDSGFYGKDPFMCHFYLGG